MPNPYLSRNCQVSVILMFGCQRIVVRRVLPVTRVLIPQVITGLKAVLAALSDTARISLDERLCPARTNKSASPLFRRIVREPDILSFEQG